MLHCMNSLLKKSRKTTRKENDMQNEELDKTKYLCTKLLIAWLIAERNKPDMIYSSEDEKFMTESFTA